MAKLDISNVIRVTLLTALMGLSNVNTSALALFTAEVPITQNFGTAQIYLEAPSVAIDFGTASATYRLATMIFSQNPNILSAGGYLVVIPQLAAAPAAPATILSRGPVDLTQLTQTNYGIKPAIDGGAAAHIAIGAINLTSLATVAASLNVTAISTAGLVFTVSGTLSAAYVTLATIAASATKSITLSADATGTDIAPLLNIDLASATGAATGVERVKDAILRTKDAVPYFGMIIDAVPASSAVLTEIAATVQTLNKMLFVGSNLSADITGMFLTLQNSGMNQTRCLYYSNSVPDAVDFAAGYASRGLSINFSGFKTAHTMHLKQITGKVADPGLTQTLLNSCQNNGVDVYADFGVPKVFTSGGNGYFDAIYCNLAFKLQLQIAGFNYLAQTNTKVPQTEEGMNGLKGAYRKICDAFVQNGVFAPGTWTDSTTFGDPSDHIRNIKDQGFYIYSLPIASQSTVDRNARKAPFIYLAAKSAGAIHSSDVLAYVNP